MSILKQEIDLSMLSEEAKKELMDFYSFLVNKYGKARIKKTKKFKKMVSSPLRVKSLVIPPREQLHER